MDNNSVSLNALQIAELIALTSRRSMEYLMPTVVEFAGNVDIVFSKESGRPVAILYVKVEDNLLLLTSGGLDYARPIISDDTTLADSILDLLYLIRACSLEYHCDSEYDVVIKEAVYYLGHEYPVSKANLSVDGLIHHYSFTFCHGLARAMIKLSVNRASKDIYISLDGSEEGSKVISLDYAMEDKEIILKALDLMLQKKFGRSSSL